jgi:hypothetical protein
MDSEKDYREIFRAAGARWLDGDPSAIEDFERGITKALEAGDITTALSAHQRLLVWKPADAELHRRVAQQIAAARDRSDSGSAKESPLARSPLFSGVPREELATLLSLAAPSKVPAGSAVVREGEPGDSLFLIASGKLHVTTKAENGQEIPLAELGPGDFFGEVALLTRRPRTATVTAVTDVDLLRIDQAALGKIRQRHPDIDASLAEFHRRRAEKTIEALIERLRRPAS